MDNIQITKDCVQEVSNIGSTTYMNICNGTSHVVPWGSADWIGGLVVGTLIAFFIAFVIWVVKELNN